MNSNFSINREYTPMINKFLIESFVNNTIEKDIKASLFYKKFEYSKELTSALKNKTGLKDDTITSLLEKRKRKIKTYFDLEPITEADSIENKTQNLKFILEGFDFEESSNTEVREKTLKKHNRQFLRLLFESGLSTLIDQSNSPKELIKHLLASFDDTTIMGGQFSDLSNHEKNLKALTIYLSTLSEEVTDAIIEEMTVTKDEDYVTEFGEYNFMISTKFIQPLLKQRVKKDEGIIRVRQLKTLRQKAVKFKIRITKNEASKFTIINVKDLLTTTKKRDAYQASIHAPLLKQIDFITKQ